MRANDVNRRAVASALPAAELQRLLKGLSDFVVGGGGLWLRARKVGGGLTAKVQQEEAYVLSPGVMKSLVSILGEMEALHSS
jgi:hypothetical protein